MNIREMMASLLTKKAYCGDASTLMADACRKYRNEVSADEPLDTGILITVAEEEIAKQKGVVISDPIELPDELKVAEADGNVTAEELAAMNRSALREYASKLGIETSAFSKKADIIAAITKEK